jgi:hypothetical protein
MSSNLTPKFLIDANLPRYFSLWKGEEFIKQNEIDDTWTDEQIWTFATENFLTIVTKDSDFFQQNYLSLSATESDSYSIRQFENAGFFFNYVNGLGRCG